MNNLVLALEITALGMGLVFAAIILLWWMMNLLTAITRDEDTSSIRATASDSTGHTAAADYDMKAKAAAVAVAIAFAEQKATLTYLSVEPPPSVVSAWQLGMRTRQLYEKPTPILRKPRKIG